MDYTTITRIRGVQALYNLPRTGYLDKATWETLNSMRWMDEEL